MEKRKDRDNWVTGKAATNDSGCDSDFDKEEAAAGRKILNMRKL